MSWSFSSSSSLSLYFFFSPGIYQPSSSRQKSCKNPLSFLTDCVVTKPRPWMLLNFLFAVEESPESVQTIKSDVPKSFRIFFSNGVMEGCSFWFPSKTEKERGMPSASMNSPICTMGLGRCSFETPYFLKSSSSSISK